MEIEKQELLVDIPILINQQSQEEIFNKIIESISPIDFRKLAGEVYVLDDTKKLEPKHYLVPVTDIVLEKSKKLGYSLAKYNGIIYVFNGCFWVTISEDKLKRFLGESASKMGIDLIESKYFRYRENLLSQFYSSAYFESPETSKDKVLINLKNGTFEVTEKNQFLRVFNPEDFMRYQLSFSYDTTATAPLFHKYLDRVLPEKELQNILAEYIGYVFVKNIKLEKVLFLYGGGNNGKSVFYEVLLKLIGIENMTSHSMALLNNENYRSDLDGKLLNYGSEIKEGLESDIFKLLASGEPIGAKRLYKDPFTMRDYAKLMFNANKLPQNIEHSQAYFRRILIIPFLVDVTPEEKDIHLHKKIIDKELSGVFNWVLLGLDRILKNKDFTYSKTSSTFLENYKKESDEVLMFLDEKNYMPCFNGGSTGLTKLFEEYRLYCSAFGYYADNLKKFRNRLETNKLKVKKTKDGLFVSVIKSSNS